jgi:molybdopterin/thiamine biosynthesis adenylyltransferase
MTNCTPLSHDDLRRYARHLVLPDFGEAAQRKLMASSVLFIGAGGLGAASLSYLAATGIGHIGIVDDDKVELSNLGRQIIHETGDIGRAKAHSAEDRISEINPEVRISTHLTKLDATNAQNLIKDYDMVIDGSDNFETRYALNDASIARKKPWVYAAVRGWHGQITSFRPDINPSPCYRCLVPEAPHGRNDCAEGGVVSPLVGIMGSMQALEAIRILTGAGSTLHGKLQRYDGLKASWSQAHITHDMYCPSCGKQNFMGYFI